MEAYKITSTISKPAPPTSGWSTPFADGSIDKVKEFYHFSKFEAQKHINFYINTCAKSGIEIKKKSKKKTETKDTWCGNRDMTYYTITLECIDIKP